MPLPDDLAENAFLGGALRIRQPRAGFRSASDAVLLAAACLARPGERALDWGCGAGAAGLCLGRRVGGLDLHGLEANAQMAALSEANAAANGLGWRVHVGRAEDPPAALKALEFDHLLTNPPYFAPNAAPSPVRLRDEANRESAPPDIWLANGIKRLRPGGRLTLIHRAERLCDILRALEGKAGSVEILPLAPRAGEAAKLMILRAVKGGRAPLRLLAPFALHGADGRFAPEAEAVLRHGKSIAEAASFARPA